jgi:Protein of unknown function (DUF2877)
MPPHRPQHRPAWPAAVSVLVADLVAGPPAPATVLAAHRFALYLSAAGRVLPVVTADAVALPTAVRLAVSSHDLAVGAPGGWGVGAGDVVTVGGGRAVLPGADVVAVRSWRPARVRRANSDVGCPGSHLGARLELERATTGTTVDGSGWLADGIRAVVSCLGRAAAHEAGRRSTRVDEVEAAVAGLVGRGPGLTPSGDDALAGALLVAHSLGIGAPLAEAVRSRLGVTTAVSAALLDAAADGFAACPVVTLVDAAVADDADAVRRALPAVLALGHTSGADTVTGVRAALGAFTPDSTHERSAA